MTKAEITKMQNQLKRAGFYNGTVDGIWGPVTQAAWDASLAACSLRKEMELPATLESGIKGVAWSAKVSELFVERVIWIAQALGMPDDGPDNVMACMAWESGETFRSDIVNGAGSGAVGLIQFMPATAKGLGTSTDALKKMTPEDQLNYVYKYFSPYKGRLKTLSDLYSAIIWPAAVGKAEDFVLWDQAGKPTTYFQNKGLDINKDGKITKAECTAKVTEKLVKGRQKSYVRA